MSDGMQVKIKVNTEGIGSHPKRQTPRLSCPSNIGSRSALLGGVAWEGTKKAIGVSIIIGVRFVGSGPIFLMVLFVLK